MIDWFSYTISSADFSAGLYDSESNSSSLLGIAYLGGVCLHEYGLSVSVVGVQWWDVEQAAATAAHELGHKWVIYSSVCIVE